MRRSTSIHALLLVASFASVASSPPTDEERYGKLNVIVENNYAESIFNATYKVTSDVEDDPRWDGELEGTLLSDVRLDIGEIHEVERVFEAPINTEFTVEFIGRSLGEDHTFTIEQAIPDDAFGPVECTFVYDYDLANAAFKLGNDCVAR